MRLKIFCSGYYGDICDKEVNPFCEKIEKTGGKIISIKVNYEPTKGHYRVYVIYKEGVK